MSLKQQNEIILPKNYTPSDVELYMIDMHTEYFRMELMKRRGILQDEWTALDEQIHSSADVDIDVVDKANHDVILFSGIKRLESIQKSITSIDLSLDDIENKRYGYCKKTGKEIGIKRLLANPEAKLCIEAQENEDINTNMYEES